jgi:sialic acid synthase SpsE
MSEKIVINGREIGPDFKPFVIPEIGINHEGDFQKAKKMIEDAKQSGAECVKFQCHVIEDEMIQNNVIPANANESIWEIMKRCSFSEEQEIELKEYTEQLGLIYLSTPFSREAANRLNRMGVSAYKIGSGECNNYPLIKHIANFGKPMILSTGMNNINSIEKSIDILKKSKVDYAVLHVTSIYPTPYEKVRLGAIKQLKEKFPGIVLGLSDHSIKNYTCFASIPLGSSIIEKHFTSEKNWPGPDIPVSIDPNELEQLIEGSNAIHEALGNKKNILDGEKETSEFAYSCVVSIKDIIKDENISMENIWVKRPGNGQIKAELFESILNKKAIKNIEKNTQLRWDMIE